MPDESHDVFRTLRGNVGAVLSTFVVILLALAAIVTTLRAFSQQDNGALMTMSEPQEMFGLPYPPDPVDCGPDHFEYASSLGQLPGRIRLDAGPLVDVADLGEPYDGGRGPAGLPIHRFAGAAVGHDHVFVVIEGVRISTVSHDVLWVFERRGARWVGHTELGGGSTVPEILNSICRQATWRTHVTAGDTRIDCDVDKRGRIAIQYVNTGHRGSFEARTRLQWRIRPEEIREPGNPNPISAEQRSDLLRAFQAVRPSLHDSDECVFWVDQYLEALTAPPEKI